MRDNSSIKITEHGLTHYRYIIHVRKCSVDLKGVENILMNIFLKSQFRILLKDEGVKAIFS